MESGITTTASRCQLEPLEHRRMFSASLGATYVQPLVDSKGPAFAVDEAAVAGVEARHQVTFKGRLEGTYSVTPVPNMPPFIVDVLLNAQGNATQLGHFTLVFPHRVDRSSVPSTAIGIYHLTAANGDTLTAAVLGQATPTSTPGVLHGVETATITGGTGRFAGATGGFICERLIDTVHFTTVGSFSGTISTGGARAIAVVPTDTAPVAFSNQQIGSDTQKDQDSGSIAFELLQ
jgi:hypothetical protein